LGKSTNPTAATVIAIKTMPATVVEIDQRSFELP